MLNVTGLNGFGAGGEYLPPITYANMWGVPAGGASSTTISGVNFVTGTKTLVFGVMQSANGYAQRYTTGVSVGGVAATLRHQGANTGYEYYAHMSFWEITTTVDVADIIVYRTSVPTTWGGGVVRMWVLPTPLGVPADTLTMIYTNTSGNINKYRNGVTLAMANGFAGTPWISGIANSGNVYWDNCAAYEIPTADVVNSGVYYGPVSQYYNQMLIAASWLPPPI